MSLNASSRPESVTNMVRIFVSEGINKCAKENFINCAGHNPVTDNEVLTRKYNITLREYFISGVHIKKVQFTLYYYCIIVYLVLY